MKNETITLKNEVTAAREIKRALLNGAAITARCHDGEIRNIVRVRNVYHPCRIVQGATKHGEWFTVYGYTIAS